MQSSSDSNELFSRIHGFLSAMERGETTPEQQDEFESLICDNPAACDLYICYMATTSGLRASSMQPVLEADEDIQAARAFSTAVSRETTERSDKSLPPSTPTAVPPVDVGYSDMIGYYSGWPVAYLLATVILGLGLAFAAVTHVSQPTQLVLPSPGHRHEALGDGQEAGGDGSANSVAASTVVARITGMLDCVWKGSGNDNQKSVIRNHKSPVALGDHFALRSGLLEITYDAGAKVILQGPVVYQVNSATGGYLSVGKLTARLEKEPGIRPNQKSEITNQKSFTIATPTATITDLGTEFGVHVDSRGNTLSHVFRGSVRMTPTGSKRSIAQAAVLRAGQTGQCSTASNTVASTNSADGSSFVRGIDARLSRQVRITETFDGNALSPAFEQMPAGHYLLRNGTAEYRRPTDVKDAPFRGFIRTKQTDFCDKEFTFEATFEVKLPPQDVLTTRHWVFFGIGDGEPNPQFYDEVKTALILGFIVDNGRAYVRLCHPGSLPTHDLDRVVVEVTPEGGLPPGRHRFRMWKSGKWVTFAVDANVDRPPGNYYQSPTLDLTAVAPLLNKTNSRLFVGTGHCDTMAVRFDELSIVQKQSHAKEDDASDASAKPPLKPTGERQETR